MVVAEVPPEDRWVEALFGYGQTVPFRTIENVKQAVQVAQAAERVA